MEIKLKNKMVYVGGAILVLIMLAAWIVIFKPPVFVSFARTAFKSVKVWRAGGEEGYIAKTLATQSRTNAKETPAASVIETSQLPILRQYVSLPKDFPEGAGALAAMNDKLVVMSRTGGFYQYRSGRFLKLDWGDLPNGLHEYILNSNAALNSDSLRASSITYDKSSQRIFVGYNRYVSPGTNRLVISSLEVDAQTLKKSGDWKTEFESDLFDSAYTSQAGGGRVMVRDGELYFSVGYPEKDTVLNGKKVPASQNPNSTLGKILRKNIKSGKIELLSMGHRNVQGMAFTRSGDLLSTEHGPQGGDEINIVAKGVNFGWPYRSYGTDYGSYNYRSPWEVPSGFKSEEPMYAFVPSVGLSPIQLVEGFHPAWDGDVLVGSLKAQSLFRLVVRSQRVVVSEPIWIGHRIRDMTLVAGSGIVLLTDDSLLVFLSVEGPLLRENKKNAGYNFEPKIQRCLVCHHFELSTPASLAPSLANVLGRKMGSDAFEKYSDGMKKASGVWSKETLDAFLTDPQSVVPGTSMPNLGLSPGEVKDIVKIIAR
jgi:cytochrome c2